MPTYNGEKFLRPAIESILNQTFRDFELIVIDDGSTDSTPRILAELKDKDSRLIVVTNERNLGIAGATNRGLAAAHGKYFALQDHDDISLPHRLQTQVDFLNAHLDIAVVGSAATLINDDGVPYAEFPLPCAEIDIKWRLLFHGDPLHYTSVMVRCGAIHEIGGYGEDAAFRFSEAYDPFSRIAMRHRMVNLPETLVLWRRHPEATSLQHAQQQWRSGETIAFRNLCLLDDLQTGAPPDASSRTGSDSGARYHHYLGFKAFLSTPAGKFPTLPPEQVVSGLKFFCDIQETFYKLHRFPHSAVARHRRSLNWIWGKHAVALAIRAPWDWRSRLRILVLGIRCLWHAAWSTLIISMARLVNRADRLPSLTVPTIQPMPDRTHNPTHRGQPGATSLDKKSIKRAIKTAPIVRRAMLGLVIPAVRGYIRYLPIPFGKQAAWNVVGIHHYGLEPPKWDFIVRTVFGSRISANTRDVIGKYIYYFGIWEPNLTRWIERRLAPGDGFIDVGANIGYFTLLASKLVGDTGRVVSVEALPAIFAALENNLRLNDASNVRTVNCAAWDAEEMLTIYTQSEDLPGQTTVMPGWAEKYHLESRSRVQAAPLSAILTLEEFSTARIVKIDAEGAEWHVLSGMKPLMGSCRDDLEIAIEINSKMLEVEGRTPQDVLDFFAAYGFHAYRIENDYLQERYLYRETPQVPRRIERIVTEQTDVIFSRIDAESLESRPRE